jgi:single-strand DNA-binding protein
MSLNKVILIGNVGKDPDIRYFDSGNANANFTMATSERGYKLANGTEIPERTEWHNIVASRERAQFVEKYVKKGSLVYVEGKIRTRNYDDKEGNKRYFTEILADRIEFYSSGARRDENQTSTAETGNSPLPSAPEVPSPPVPADDLPF